MSNSYRMTSRFFCSAQYNTQHYIPQTFAQFGALNMHNLDDKDPILVRLIDVYKIQIRHPIWVDLFI